MKTQIDTHRNEGRISPVFWFISVLILLSFFLTGGRPASGLKITGEHKQIK